MCRTTQPALALATSSAAPSSPIASLRFICPSRMASVVAQPACALAVRQSSQSAATVAALLLAALLTYGFERPVSRWLLEKKLLGKTGKKQKRA